MAAEIIDLTGSPSRPPRSSKAPRILNFGSSSVERIHFEKAAMPSWACPNPNLRYTNPQQTTVWPASGHTYHPSQISTRFQTMHGDQFATVLEPVLESNAFLFPNGARLREPWTPREHELFLMGLIKYGKGRWSKIARHFLWNKTPQQVQSYAASFFRHLPSTYLYSFRRRNPTYSTSNLMTRSRTLLGASSPYSMPMIANEPQAQQTLMLFPKKSPFFSIAPCGEASSSTTTYGYGFQMQTGGASTSVTASGNGEVDLELRLG